MQPAMLTRTGTDNQKLIMSESESGETAQPNGIGSPSDTDGDTNDKIGGIDSGESNSATADGSNNNNNDSIENNKAECMLSVLINTNLLRASLENNVKKYFFSFFFNLLHTILNWKYLVLYVLDLHKALSKASIHTKQLFYL